MKDGQETLRLRILVHLDRAPGLVAGVADVLERTLCTIRFTREAELPSMPDDLVREQNPTFARDDFHQVLFDFWGIVLSG